MTKIASTDHPVHDLIARRWSPYGFDERPVSKDDLCSLFEAARWAASSYNEQPWSYILATSQQPNEFARLLACLVEPNREWACHAPVLALSVAKLQFARNDKPNAAAIHDLGLAAGNLSFEATARGLAVHQMIGILPEVARQTYGIPEGFQPLTGLAIGYAAEAASLEENFGRRDVAPRQRKPLSEFVFSGKWNETSKLVS